ncbi:MAG: O-methyltransferase [Verrucomicrobiota bacterium]
MKSILRKFRARLFAGLARRSDLDALYDQVNGLIQIQNAMNGKSVLRPLRGWAMSPDAMTWILADLQERTAPRVIEFGSGQSTVILAAALKHLKGELVSIEHDLDYSSVIQRQVNACGLAGQVQFIHAPLCHSSDELPIRSYSCSALPNASFDVVLIDGPPLANGNLTRLTPLRWAAQHLKPGGAIFLDDTARDAEQQCLKQLSAEFGQLQAVPRNAEKGLMELRFAPN